MFPVNCHFVVAGLSCQPDTRDPSDASKARVAAKLQSRRPRLASRSDRAPQAEAMASSNTDFTDPQNAAETPAESSRSGMWRRLWPVYCIGVGIVLILVGALA
jgi:hypothetical protein